MTLITAETPDRIRQRALENMGYSVYRVRNRQVEGSTFDVAGNIVDRYYQLVEVEGEKKTLSPKIRKIHNTTRLEPLSEDLERLIPAWTRALNSKLTFENWSDTPNWNNNKDMLVHAYYMDSKAFSTSL